MTSALAEEAATVLEPFPEAPEAEQDAIRASENASPGVPQADCQADTAENMEPYESTAGAGSRGPDESQPLLASGCSANLHAAGQRGIRPPTPGSEAIGDTGK